MTHGRLSLVLLTLALGSVRVAGGGGPSQLQAQAVPATAVASPCGPARIYAGASIDVDFQGSDLRTTLRLLADTGGINLVLDPSVPPTGTVDIKLSQVPWDQVFAIILKASQLECEIQGGVVRVVLAKKREEELKALADRLSAERDATAREAMTVRTFQLNYAKGEDLIKLLVAPVQGMLSKYAKAHFESRTNTLLVTGLPQDLEQAEALIRQLDRAEPQVEIEAQIVETDHDSARALGIQWGFNGRMSQELGNTSGLGFPNSGAAGGRTGTQQGPDAGSGRDPRATALERTGTAVNLPAGSLGTAPSSAVGLTLGAINGAFNLDMALSALEHKGQTKILSSPKVVTQNNQEAEMTTGFQVPFQTVSNNTVVIQFRDAALKLTVKPQITGANTVVMAIVLENGFPDFSHNVNGNPTIVTQRASTNVLVPDTATVVIGGIRRSKEDTINDQTPGLGNVPLLGWLFRRNESSASNQELLIFITPRILRGLP